MVKANFNVWWFALLLLQANHLKAAPIVEHWQAIHEAFFNHKTVSKADNQIQIEAPTQAEDAALVPFSFKVKLNQSTLSKVLMFVDANPIMLTATFNLLTSTDNFQVETRIRLEKNSTVRVIAETQTGELFMQTVDIKTPGGGCGGGGNSDEAALRASAGKMKVRYLPIISNENSSNKEFLKHTEANENVFSFHIKHPMRTGFERTLQGYYAKAWYINRLDFIANTTPFLYIDVGPGISADPMFKLTLPANAHTLHVNATDNEGKPFQYAESFSPKLIPF